MSEGVPEERGWPAIDFPAYGLDGSWKGPRWISHIDGSMGRPATGVTLAHGDRPWPGRGHSFVLVQTFRRGLHPPDVERTSRELAFAALFTLFNILLPDLEGSDRQKYIRHGMRYVDFRSTKADTWTETEWLVDGAQVPARFTWFAGGWTGFTEATEDVVIAITAYGVRPQGVQLRRLESSEPYHFDMAAPLKHPDVFTSATKAALGEAVDLEPPYRSLHSDMRRVLDNPPPEPKPDPNAKYRVTAQSTYSAEGWPPWEGPPPPDLEVEDPDVPRMGCCVCGKHTGDDPANELVYLRIQLVSGTFEYSLGAHLACLPEPLQPKRDGPVRRGGPGVSGTEA